MNVCVLFFDVIYPLLYRHTSNPSINPSTCQFIFFRKKMNDSYFDDYHLNMFKFDDMGSEIPDLSFLKQTEEITSIHMSLKDKRINGTFLNTILIREVDDTYIPFQTNVKIVRNLTELNTIIECYCLTNNILIESRLLTYISYLTVFYGDELLIYNVNTLSVQTIYEFYAHNFGVQSNELTLTQIKQLFMTYLVTSIFLKDLRLTWNINNVIQSIKINIIGKRNDIIKSETLDVLINYYKIPKPGKLSLYNVIHLCKLFHSTFSKGIDNLQPWSLEGFTMNELYASLMLLKANQFQFIIDRVTIEGY